MLKELEIQGFKRFKSATFGLTPLTILAGMNGAGKTSVIHALLLMREATRRADGLVALNGPFGLELGNFEDIQNWETQDSVCLQLTDTANTGCRWDLSAAAATALYAKVAQKGKPPKAFTQNKRMFQYICAERFGPRSILGSAAVPADFLEVGCHGEYSAQLLHVLDKFEVDPRRCCPGLASAQGSLLKTEAERWLSCIARPIQMDTENLAGTSVSALRFRTPGGDWVRPPNMGFGVTYALPVILAALTAGQGGLLIVENPEAHLHPAGQSQMGHFLASMAAAGVQIVLETHSDHVLNGIRRAIGEHRILPAVQATVHFFDVDGTAPHTLAFTETGGVSDWPSGFFDQFQVDVAALTRVRRPR